MLIKSFFLAAFFSTAFGLDLPPSAFFAGFAETNSLRAVVLHSTSKGVTRCKSAFADFIASIDLSAFCAVGERQRPKPKELQNRLELHVLFDEATLCKLNGTNDETAQNLLKNVFETRPWTDKDFWLVDVTASNGDLGAIREFFAPIRLDIDDDVFGFVYDADSGLVKIYEVYKIAQDNVEVEASEYGNWTSEAGFEVNTEHKWKRRSDFKGHHFKVATLFSPPYVTVMEKLGNGEYKVEGMFVDIFLAIKVI